MTEEKKDVVVKIDHVSKSFKLPVESSTSLKTLLINWTKGIKGYTEQKVLKDISFEVQRGDFFGIVGRNGAGKSTLLKIISQIYTPDSGSVTVNGRLVSFIELGVGFNPELTGKENVYLNGAMLGFSVTEIDEMYDDIVEFADLKEFMNQKLKNYSSGMQVRLAFSVAIKAKGDVLVLDEILAVGDEAFQRKSNDYFMQAKRENRTIILVTHDMGAVQKYANKAIMIKDGEIFMAGSPAEIANAYSQTNFEQSQKEEENKKDNTKKEKYKPGTSVLLPKFELKAISKDILKSNEEFEFEISYKVTKDIPTGVGFSVLDLTSGGAYSIIDDGAVDHEIFKPWNNKKGQFKKIYKLPLKSFNNRDFMIVATAFTSSNLGVKGDFESIGFVGTDRGLKFYVRDDKNVFGPLLKEQGKFAKENGN
ncbi:MAG: ABC transporter ATP-binding protein [Lactobacillaceae bacterium]|jgi:ABC-2 type transport system ATP-binding protein|nr:ABC transporter ATP-binding protein [Lactobacillaceae bacterium]